MTYTNAKASAAATNTLLDCFQVEVVLIFGRVVENEDLCIFR